MGKTDAEVIIGGKVFTMSGYEGEEYLQRVASYLNGKLGEMNKTEGFAKLPPDTRNIMVQLNIADDYFKKSEEMEALKRQVEDKEKDLYDLKHELIATQIKLENTENSVKHLQEELSQSSHKMVRLETELRKS